MVVVNYDPATDYWTPNRSEPVRVITCPCGLIYWLPSAAARHRCPLSAKR